nr:NB-ARC domains-containing protein [Tanacetum cinerariifolium]
MEVKSAFLNGLLEEVYVKQQEGYVTKGQEEHKTKPSKYDGGEAIDSDLFKSLFGSLRYLRCTRPDILFTVFHGRAYEKTFGDCEEDPLLYQGVVDYGMFYLTNEDFKIIGYSDSDLAENKDNGRHTTGFIFFLGNNAFTWSSKKQHIVTVSSCEAEITRSKEIHSELKKWERSLSHIQSFLEDASQKEVTQAAVKQWLNGLQHLAYDIDDVLDALATDTMYHQFTNEPEGMSSKVRKLIPACCTNFSLSTRMDGKLNSITTRLHELIDEKNNLGLIVKDGGQKNKNRIYQTSLVDAPSIVGREGDKNELLQKLLDDIWSDKLEDWETLAAPFFEVARGSKIIITTRKREMLRKLGHKCPYVLQKLSHNDAFSLFGRHAGISDFESYPTLRLHGEGIVKKCDGLPLALKALGSLLRTKTDEEDWKQLLNNEIWMLEDGGGIADYVFEKDDLILLWMAEGFLHNSATKSSMERLGEEYFQELLSSLQTLSNKIAVENNDFFLSWLKNLKNLQGNISIQGLDKVQSARDIREVNLSQKRVSDLAVVWSNDFNDTRNETLENGVMNALKPHSDNLEGLLIESYGGKVFPNWIGNPSFLLLTCVRIKGCRKCTFLPPLGQLPSLKELKIKSLDEVKVVGLEFLGTGIAFPKLESLRFEKMNGWEVWSTNSGVVDDVFPRLQTLAIVDCPNLVEVSFVALPSMRVLDLKRCGDGVLTSLIHAASAVTK